MTKPQLPTIGIIGIGLIGSSLARAIKKYNLAEQIFGYDQSSDVRAQAIELTLIDRSFEDMASLIKASDLIILATPVGAIENICEQIFTHAKPDTIIMDVGSIKGTIAQTAARILKTEQYFVPAHPVAGTEQSGPKAGFDSLFKDRWCIITPLDRDDAPYQNAIEQVENLWRAIGAKTERMDAAHHDIALAITSHLPHLIAFTLVGAADDLESVTQSEIIKYSAGGFRDFTRIAASDPIMWRDVFLNNKQAVLEVLGRFSEELTILQRAIRWGDEETLTKSFTRGRALRRAIVDAGQERDVPNFGRDQK